VPELDDAARSKSNPDRSQTARATYHSNVEVGVA
jgi:hypothetical protein